MVASLLHRDIWVEELSEAISLATSIHADTFVLTGNRGQYMYTYIISKQNFPYDTLDQYVSHPNCGIHIHVPKVRSHTGNVLLV